MLQKHIKDIRQTNDQIKTGHKGLNQERKSQTEIDINAKEEIGYSILDQSIKRQYPKWNRIPTSYTPTSFLD